MEAFLNLLEATIASPWLYVLIFAVTAIDALFPVVPAETLLITAGAYAAGDGGPSAIALVAVATLAALVGDFSCHLVGRGAGPLARRIRHRRRGAKAFAWASRGLHTRGGMIIIAARFVPGGRTAATFTSGTVRYPRSRFLMYAALAGFIWSVYSTGIGYAGGLAFREQPLIGVATGIGISLVLGFCFESFRRLRERRSQDPAPRGRPSLDLDM
ncbi:DedA family protein [Brevibacterium daeguense]|uniref:DedA family protein n=1 Tax=Brevibacterium daeguense TaxID=909936 RepID=A0ABP8EKJ1_9MICO|nr:VTT domain-containing protein [Brevibacterium daeguense]